jgi:glycosyltransferase 2 family protein
LRAHLKNILRFGIYLGTGLAILYLVYNRQNKAYQAKCQLDGLDAGDCQLTDKILADFGTANWEWIALVLILFMVSNISRAVRWNMLLEPLSIRPSFANSFFTVMIGYFANLGLPRIGEVVRAATLARYEKAKTNQVMGTVVIDRMLDGLTMLLVVGLAILLDGRRILDYLARNADIGSIQDLLLSPFLWVLAFLGGGLFYTLYRYRDRYARHPFALRVLELLRGFRDGLVTVAKVKRPGWFLFHSVMIWAMYYLMTVVCFQAFEQTRHLGLVAGLTTFVFGTFGVVIPAPGGMGTFQFLVSEALVMYDIPGEDGFSFSMILFFSIQIFCNIFFGLLGLLLLPVLNRRREARNQPI